MIRLVNITLEIDDFDIPQFEYQLKEWIKVISFQVLPDTKKMYEDDDTFKKLVKAEKEAKKIKAVYINDNNGKYLKKD